MLRYLYYFAEASGTKCRSLGGFTRFIFSRSWRPEPKLKVLTDFVLSETSPRGLQAAGLSPGPLVVFLLCARTPGVSVTEPPLPVRASRQMGLAPHSHFITSARVLFANTVTFGGPGD